MSKFYPKKGQNYWMINSRFNVAQATHNGSNKSKARIEAGNAFRTQPEAYRFRAGMLSLSKHINKRWWEFWR